MPGPVLIAGGYGVVGAQLAALVRRRDTELPLLIGGRSQALGEKAASEFTNAASTVMDVTADDPLAGLNIVPSVVIAAVNDPGNTLMRASVSRAIPYIDITRWTERLLEARALADSMKPRASVTLASSWMAGVSAILARQACDGFAEVDSINTSILFRLKDKAGPNSVEYADRLAIPFRVWEAGRWRRARPMTEPLKVDFPSGETARAYRFDEPSQETLVSATGARAVASRIAYDDASAMQSIVFLVRSGLWRMISGPAFAGLRRSLIYNPGDGAAHEIVVEVSGGGALRRASLLDRAGQTHLTAVGAYIQLCEVLGLEGRPSRPAGVYLPEHATDFAFARKILEEEGVAVELSA